MRHSLCSLPHRPATLQPQPHAAPLQVLERIAGLLEPGGGGITLVERGDCAAVPRHPDFRLLAAMNPATDAGKHDLPAQLRNRWGGWWHGNGNGCSSEGCGHAMYPTSRSCAASASAMSDTAAMPLLPARTPCCSQW
jgi:hypothetical protein